MPYITLIRDRGEEVFLPKSVYEDRKEQYIKRIEAITAYAGSDEVCRSQQLLRYFGEEDVEECGHCDVCLAGKEKPMTLENPTVKKILALLSDKRPHPLREVASVDAPQGEISRAVRFLDGGGEDKAGGRQTFATIKAGAHRFAKIKGSLHSEHDITYYVLYKNIMNFLFSVDKIF